VLIEFKNKELNKFTDKIEKESIILINEIIKNHCPIKIGEKIKTIYYRDRVMWLIVSKITLMAVDSWGWHGNKLSFSYEGIPIKKNGEPMKNRKPVWFDHFEKKGKIYSTPSYSRLIVDSAKMYSRE
jgi:hypothetical protein